MMCLLELNALSDLKCLELVCVPRTDLLLSCLCGHEWALHLFFQAMLLFIYTDKLPVVHEITGSSSMCTSTNMVQHLLAVSDLYNLDRLKLLCESKLCEELSSESVATTLALAEQHQCSQLKAICLKFAASPANLGGACCSLY